MGNPEVHYIQEGQILRGHHIQLSMVVAEQVSQKEEVVEELTEAVLLMDAAVGVAAEEVYS